MSRIWKLSLAVVAMLAIAGAAVGFVNAQTQGEPDTNKVDINFVGRLADNLGVTQDELEAAIQATQLEIVDELLADGKIDENRAAELRDRIESGDGGLFFPGRGHHRPFRDGFGLGVIAETIGVTPQVIFEGWQNGQSLAQIAEANGSSGAAVADALMAQVEEHLAQAVADDKLTQAEADEKLADAATRIDELINHEGPPEGPKGFPGPARDFAPPFENGVPEDAPTGAGLGF